MSVGRSNQTGVWNHGQGATSAFVLPPEYERNAHEESPSCHTTPSFHLRQACTWLPGLRLPFGHAIPCHDGATFSPACLYHERCVRSALPVCGCVRRLRPRRRTLSSVSFVRAVRARIISVPLLLRLRQCHHRRLPLRSVRKIAYAPAILSAFAGMLALPSLFQRRGHSTFFDS